MKKCLTFTMVSFALVSFPTLEAQETTQNLLENLETDAAVVSGDWNLSDEGLSVSAEKAARISLGSVPRNYSLSIEFTRIDGNDVVAVILPVGSTSPAFELSGWAGQSHGLSRVDGLPTRDEDNPASVRPGRLENGQRHRLVLDVSTEGEEATVSARLNGEALLRWQGNRSRLQPNFALNLPEPNTLGLAVSGSR